MLNTSIDQLPKTSPITIRRLKSLNINTYWDLLNYFPSRYENYSLKSKIADVQPGETVTIIGQIGKISNLFTRRGMRIQKITVGDESGEIEAVWFNQPYLIRLFNQGHLVALAGKAEKNGKKLSIQPEEYQLLYNNAQVDLIHVGRLVPIYPEKKGLSSRVIREKINHVLRRLNRVEEIFPKEILTFNRLIDRTSGYRNIHFPADHRSADDAKNRLAFEEVFVIQLSALLTKKSWEKQPAAKSFAAKYREKINDFINRLPFRLTDSQRLATDQIIDDLLKNRPMNRFLQGDVGSGKTVVAVIACYFAYLNGYQSLMMAPTEILANQHYQTINQLFKKLKTTNIPKIGLQTASNKIKNWKLEIGNYDLIVGTHALLNKKLNFDRVGLVVIDEQHRFGVNQRSLLKEKGINPHLLTMTATPIPRTVTLTLYGELDLTLIDEMPPDRLPVKTFFVPGHKRNDGYRWIKNQIKQNGAQAFIVCPLIEESETETMKSVKAATKEYENLKTGVFHELNITLLHGRIKAKNKNKILTDFKNKKSDILVATPVVEVGIDVGNASIMMIEAAERYGLAQLHQLRGRVGRGAKQSYCFLFSEIEDEAINKRLNFFARTSSGLALAEYDLHHRGPGEIFGTKQHGFINLKIARMTDAALIRKTKNAVAYFAGKYAVGQFPNLKRMLDDFKSVQIARD